MNITSDIIKGTGVAIVTPFLNGNVDHDSLSKLINHVNQDDGVDYIVVLGTTSETVTLNKEEKSAIINTIIEANNHRVPLVLGAGSNNTHQLIEEIKLIAKDDFVAILSVAPYYNKPTQSGYLAHYQAVADASALPIILYNVPSRTGSNMLAETTLALSEHNNIIGMKEASGNMEQSMTIAKYAQPEFALISGDDALTLPLMACGYHGVISVVANSFPVQFSEMVRAIKSGDISSAANIHYELFSFTQLIFQEGNPGGIKAALSIQRLINEELRLPLVNVSAALKMKIEAEVMSITGKYN
ncbi:MAG: 4-hydroxy-tetrahydrodipicolinate synthase [Bacteroidota bacterium]|nr:4-hydroxy-tetrahydrodipicolinate synthase [Bacteroidota bacterium]